MVVDPQDSESVSCGSFFMNPSLTKDDLEAVEKSLREKGESVDRLPIFNAADRYKISAAFLIEKAGFPKGYEKQGAGISKHHALAIVNRGCTRKEILNLAEEIVYEVYRRFGVRLEMEPVMVGD
jgi:UDP-N-acetylmuramate dehydrogenase